MKSCAFCSKKVNRPQGPYVCPYCGKVFKAARAKDSSSVQVETQHDRIAIEEADMLFKLPIDIISGIIEILYHRCGDACIRLPVAIQIADKVNATRGKS
jgi:hypothetical protein